MEDAMTMPLQAWRGRSLSPEPVDDYARKPKPTKVVKCRYELATSTSSVKTRTATQALQRKHYKAFRQWIGKVQIEDALVRELAAAPAKIKSTEATFRKLADHWSSEIGNVSSIDAMTSHPKYKEIVALGWDVVPYMLADLQKNRGLWFTALNEITGIRPFDRRDAGDFRRMADAWIEWGKNKQLI